MNLAQAISQAFLDAIDRLKKYNINPFSSSANPFGMSGVGGTDANYERQLRDVVTTAEGVAAIADEVAQTQSAIVDEIAQGQSVLQGIADNIAGALADTVPVSTQGRDLIAASTPAAARDVIGALGTADVTAQIQATPQLRRAHVAALRINALTGV